MTRVGERKRSFNLSWQNDGRQGLIYPRVIWSDGQIDAVQAPEGAPDRRPRLA